MSVRYAEMLGYTQDELESYFSEYLGQLVENMECSLEELKAQLAHHYNGYRFSKGDVVL